MMMSATLRRAMERLRIGVGSVMPKTRQGGTRRARRQIFRSRSRPDLFRKRLAHQALPAQHEDRPLRRGGFVVHAGGVQLNIERVLADRKLVVSVRSAPAN
jgi:hypothetical protein